jgi:hypothetical protein
MAQVLHAFGAVRFSSRHCRLNGNLHMFDTAFFIILGAFGFVRNHQITSFPVCRRIADGLKSAGIGGHQPSVSQNDPRGVDILADNNKFLVQTWHFHSLIS